MRYNYHRLLIQWLISTFSLLIVAALLPGISISSGGAAFSTAGVIGLLNAMLWPLFMRYALPITIATFGLASLILNGIIISLAAGIMPGFIVENLGSAIFAAFGLTIFTTLTRQLLAINDDDTYYRNVIKRQARKNVTPSDTDTPGVLILQIDGLAYNVLQRAIRDGNAPTLAKWLSSGSYRLESWETDWSSQTGASQAGILMGSNKDIPAFRWYEKETGKSYSFSRPGDLSIIEERLTEKNGLLSENGASRGNLFSGDAQYTLLTFSTIRNPDKKHFGRDYYAYFANPYNFTRTLILMITDMIREVRSSHDQKRYDVQPRIDNRGKFYPLIRAWTTIVQRDIMVQTLISDMYKGRSVMYADFVGYDEVSHHTGIERHESLAILRDIDQQISRLAKAAEESPKPYHVILVSDHGQTQGATFSQRTGYSLEKLVEKLTKNHVTAETENTESLNYLNAAVTEASGSTSFLGRMLDSFTNKYHKEEKANGKNSAFYENIKIMASGCLGLIYFTKFKRRLTLEDINKYYPDLIDGLCANPYIGFLLVNSKRYGGIVISRHGTYFLRDDHVEGENPLLPFGKNAAMHIKRTHTYHHVADIMLNSIYDKTLDEVAAFEELVGSHGGLGGNQSHPFLLFPNDWDFPKSPVIGAENVHKIMKQWIAKSPD